MTDHLWLRPQQPQSSAKSLLSRRSSARACQVYAHIDALPSSETQLDLFASFQVIGVSEPANPRSARAAVVAALKAMSKAEGALSVLKHRARPKLRAAMTTALPRLLAEAEAHRVAALEALDALCDIDLIDQAISGLEDRIVARILDNAWAIR